MSSKAKRTMDKITGQQISTVVQVLSIMQNEASQMNWAQRFRISWRFLWTKDISNFFELANRNKKNEEVHNS